MLRAILVGLVACAPSVAAQSLHGDVRAAQTDVPLPYSTILLEPGAPGGRFTDDSGRFAFPDLAAGRYRLIVRAIGYLPFDTSIAVGGAPILLRIELRPMAIELPPLTVLGTRACVLPGAPARDSQPELAAVFDQLNDNAARYRLLSDAYPFRYWMERISTDSPPPARAVGVVIDTLERHSTARTRYRSGGLIFTQAGPRGRPERALRLPTVVDLADSEFHRSHCFSFGGVDTLDGRALWRVDFLAAERVRRPDVDGSAWLEADTYQLRRLVFRLTHPDRAGNALHALEATVIFGELLPAVTVPARVEAVTRYRRRGQQTRVREAQRLLQVDFLKARPGLQSP